MIVGFGSLAVKGYYRGSPEDWKYSETILIVYLEVPQHMLLVISKQGRLKLNAIAVSLVLSCSVIRGAIPLRDS